MMPRIPLRAALALVRVFAVLVPASRRAEWIAEWCAELEHRSRQLARRSDSTWSADVDLIRRALGALPDAAWLRRQFTLDADAVRDTVHGLRMLATTPGFTVSVLVVFAIGIGATTAILSLTDALLVRPLSLPDADRLMTIWQVNRETGQGRLDVAPANVIDLMQRVRSFQTLAIAENWSVKHTVPGGEPQQPLPAARVTETFFEVLGLPMLYGRGFAPDDYRPGANRTVAEPPSLIRPVRRRSVGGGASGDLRREGAVHDHRGHASGHRVAAGRAIAAAGAAGVTAASGL